MCPAVRFFSKSPETDLSGLYGSIKVIVSNPHLIHKGLFSKTYITFDICTIPLNANVVRRYSDFEWLYQALTNRFGAQFVS